MALYILHVVRLESKSTYNVRNLLTFVEPAASLWCETAGLTSLVTVNLVECLSFEDGMELRATVAPQAHGRLQFLSAVVKIHQRLVDRLCDGLTNILTNSTNGQVTIFQRPWKEFDLQVRGVDLDGDGISDTRGVSREEDLVFEDLVLSEREGGGAVVALARLWGHEVSHQDAKHTLRTVLTLEFHS